MRNILLALALCLIAIIAGAYLFFGSSRDLTGVTDQTAQVANAPITNVSVPFTVIDAGGYAQKVTERKNVAVRDEEAYTELWEMVRGAQDTAPPAVDFDTEYVIGVFAGEKSSGGHTIEVLNVTDEDLTRTLSVAITAPGAGCMVTQAITSPYQLIRVPVSMNAHVAQDTQVESPCE